MLSSSSYCYIEEFQESFPHLSVNLKQLSKGSFDSSARTFSSSLMTIDDRKTSAAHIHQSKVDLDNINLVFPNSMEQLNINGKSINLSNQIAVFPNEEISAFVGKNFDISTLSIRPSKLREYSNVDFSRIDSATAEKLRVKKANPERQKDLHKTINFFLAETARLEGEVGPKERYIVDLQDILYFKSSALLEELVNQKEVKRKEKFSERETLRIYELIREKSVFELIDLVSVTNCSPRTLFNLVRNSFQVTPYQLVSIIRLNQIRCYLQGKAEQKKTIKNVALQFGSSSPSKLAKDYQSFFGESMQTTIKRSFNRSTRSIII